MCNFLQRIAPSLLFSGLVLVIATGCVSDERLFTEGRLQALCNEAMSMCSEYASCRLDDETYARSTFPGGIRAIVNNQHGDEELIVRLLLTEPIADGTELHVELLASDCGRVDDVRLQDVNLFEEAGDDRTFEFHLEFHGEGDHLLSVFSDMNAEYMLTVEPKVTTLE